MFRSSFKGLLKVLLTTLKAKPDELRLPIFLPARDEGVADMVICSGFGESVSAAAVLKQDCNSGNLSMSPEAVSREGKRDRGLGELRTPPANPEAASLGTEMSEVLKELAELRPSRELLDLLRATVHLAKQQAVQPEPLPSVSLPPVVEPTPPTPKLPVAPEVTYPIAQFRELQKRVENLLHCILFSNAYS